MSRIVLNVTDRSLVVYHIVNWLSVDIQWICLWRKIKYHHHHYPHHCITSQYKSVTQCHNVTLGIYCTFSEMFTAHCSLWAPSYRPHAWWLSSMFGLATAAPAQWIAPTPAALSHILIMRLQNMKKGYCTDLRSFLSNTVAECAEADKDRLCLREEPRQFPFHLSARWWVNGMFCWH